MDVEKYRAAKHDWLKGFLTLPNGVPSHDTFGRVFAALAPDEFRVCFAAWVAEVADAVGVTLACSARDFLAHGPGLVRTLPTLQRVTLGYPEPARVAGGSRRAARTQWFWARRPDDTPPGMG